MDACGLRLLRYAERLRVLRLGADDLRLDEALHQEHRDLLQLLSSHRPHVDLSLAKNRGQQ